MVILIHNLVFKKFGRGRLHYCDTEKKYSCEKWHCLVTERVRSNKIYKEFNMKQSYDSEVGILNFELLA